MSIFKDRTVLRSREGGDMSFDIKDNDGDWVILNSYAGGELFEFSVIHETGCFTLDREGAIELANKILDLAK